MRGLVTTTTFALLVAPLVLCLVIINVFGGIVAGVWLVVKGEWKLVVFGCLFSVFMPKAWILVSFLPSTGAVKFFFGNNDAPSRRTAFIGAFVLTLWNGLVIATWSAFIFVFFAARIRPGTAAPLLLWAYSTTMAPLAYMLSKEPEDSASTGSQLAMLVATATYAALLVSHLAEISLASSLIVVAVIVILEAALGGVLGAALTPNRDGLRGLGDSTDGP